MAIEHQRSFDREADNAEPMPVVVGSEGQTEDLTRGEQAGGDVDLGDRGQVTIETVADNLVTVCRFNPLAVEVFDGVVKLVDPVELEAELLGDVFVVLVVGLDADLGSASGRLITHRVDPPVLLGAELGSGLGKLAGVDDQVGQAGLENADGQKVHARGFTGLEREEQVVLLLFETILLVVAEDGVVGLTLVGADEVDLDVVLRTLDSRLYVVVLADAIKTAARDEIPFAAHVAGLGDGQLVV